MFYNRRSYINLYEEKAMCWPGDGPECAYMDCSASVLPENESISQEILNEMIVTVDPSIVALAIDIANKVS